MAVEICCLRSDGAAERKRGAIILIKECGETEKCRWGREMNPKTATGIKHFFIIRVPKVGLATIDPKLKEYGGHTSRILIDTTRLSSSAQSDLNADKIPTITPLELSSASVASASVG